MIGVVRHLVIVHEIEQDRCATRHMRKRLLFRVARRADVATTWPEFSVACPSKLRWSDRRKYRTFILKK